MYKTLIKTFESGEGWKFHNNTYWAKYGDKKVAFRRAGNKYDKKQFDYNFYNEELRIYMTFTRQKNDSENAIWSDYVKGTTLMDHYKMPIFRLSRMFKSNSLKGKSYIHYFYYENESDRKPIYKKLFLNFSLIQRRKLAISYKKLLKKSLLDFSGGTFIDKYMETNKQLFRENRLSNLLD